MDWLRRYFLVCFTTSLRQVRVRAFHFWQKTSLSHNTISIGSSVLQSSLVSPTRLRSANRHLLAVPRFRLNTYCRRAFSVAGPMAWNSLPDFNRDPTNSTGCFMRLLKTYLFARF